MLPGLNTYATSKGALEAHTLNLAAELEGTGVTANVYRPGTVDTSMQAYIRDQPREQIAAPLHDRFTAMLHSGALITPLSKRPVWSAVIAQFSQAFSRMTASPHSWAVVLLTAPLVASTTAGVAGRV